MTELSERERRYAVIICKSRPLSDEVYKSLVKDSGDLKSDFISALYTYYMDYDVCEEVRNSVRTPNMPDGVTA